MNWRGPTKMKLYFLDYASIVLIILKITGVIAWTWGQVLCLLLFFLLILFISGVVGGVLEAYRRN